MVRLDASTALQALSAKHRRYILLRFWQDMTQVEAGREMGWGVFGNSRGCYCGRASQVERSAIAMMRAALQG